MTKRLAILGAVVLAAVVLITYQPNFRMGLYLDDYYNIERAGRIEFADAFRQIFDPRTQTLWYRPLQGLQFFIEYNTIGGNADAYHLVNITYHVINVLLVYALVWRVSRKWLMGFVAAFFYATFTVYISGVNWSAIVEPLLGVFYLLSFWFWWGYLEKHQRKEYFLAFIAFILALMAKQTAVTIPVVFFLADRLLVGESISLVQLIRRYAPLVIAALIFMLVQYATPSTHTFAGVFGWQAGPQMAGILLQYIVLLLFPWISSPSIDLNPVEVGTPFTYVWALIAGLLLVFMWWRKRARWLIFLGAFTLLTLLPVLPFPFLEHRYAYLPIISVAVVLSAALVQAQTIVSSRRAVLGVASLGLALIASVNGFSLNDSVVAAADWTRTLRVPFRDIERQNPTFPQDTLLYFIDPITPTEGGLSGMFFLRYGKDIVVRNWTQPANFRDHNAAYVYYFDDTRKPQLINVEKNAITHSNPNLPVDYAVPLRLEGYEVPRTTIQRGTPLALVVYWRALGKLDRNYTVFARVLDAKGQMIAEYENQPRNGKLPTSQWGPNLLYADVLLVPIDANVSTGSGCILELGLFDTETKEYITTVDAGGQRGDTVIRIEPFSIVE